MAILTDFNIYMVNYWVLIPAVCIIIILSFLEKRKKQQEVCHGRPALLIPFHFLDGFENRTAYAMAFGTTTSTVVSLIMSERTLEFDIPLWATAFYVYLQATIGCLTCFPLFACLTTRYRAVGAAFCITYSLLWLILKLMELSQNVEWQINSLSNDTSVRNITIAYHILQGLPIIFCYIVLIVYCIYILHRCYTTKVYYFSKRMERSVRVHQEEHVRWVLKKFKINCAAQNSRNCNSSRTFLEQMKNSIRLRYFTKFPFFRYPARIIALSFVQLNILYWSGLLLIMTTLTTLYPWIYADFTHQYVNNYEFDLTVILSVCSTFALFVSIINGLAQIFIGARNYRYDMLKIYQGQKISEHLLYKTPQNILTMSMIFPGYQVAFMLWGVLVCFITATVLTTIPVMCIYFLANFGFLKDIISIMAQLLSFPAIVFLMFYLQVFMSKRVLLQEKLKSADENPPLNVDNRKFLEIVNYYSLFTNMAVGLFTCMFRICQNAFFGVFFIARLDRSVFPSNLETWDRGYAAYVSMLLVDNAHNNPCMRVFAHLLWTKTLATRMRQDQHHKESSDIAPLTSDNRPRHTYQGTNLIDYVTPSPSSQLDNPWTFIETNDTQRTSQALTRWYLTYTLIRNPQLCMLRKTKLTKILNTDKLPNGINNSEEKHIEAVTVDEAVLVDIDSSGSSSPAQNEVNEDVMLIDVVNQINSNSSA